MNRFIPLALVLLAPLAAGAQTPVRYVKIEEQGGQPAVPVTVTKVQMVPETVTVIENGRPVTKTITRSIPVTSTELRPLTPEVGDYFTPAGERIDPKKLADVFKKGAVLAIASDGKPLDPEVVKKNKELVAILVPKGATAPAEPKLSADEKPFAADVTLKDGAVTVTRFAVVYQDVPQQQTRKAPGGKVETVTVNVRVPITRQETITLDPKRTQVLRFDGTTVPPADWGRLLGDKAKVIVSPGGQVVPDELRKATTDAVAVVVLKAK